MSASFRPVKMIWGKASSQFLDREVLIGLLADVAARVSSQWREETYSDMTEIWIEKGKEFLNYISKDKRFSAASLFESLTENGFMLETPDLKNAISNLKALAKTWRSSISESGGLHFFVD